MVGGDGGYGETGKAQPCRWVSEDFIIHEARKVRGNIRLDQGKKEHRIWSIRRFLT